MDPNKVYRGRMIVGAKLDAILKARLSKNIKVIAFDERLDPTMQRVCKESGILTNNSCITSSTVSNQTTKEEHCPILAFGTVGLHGKEGSYLTHVTPRSGDAEALAQEIHKAIKTFDTEDSVEGILADDCNKNVGIHAGVIRRLEEMLKRPLAHLICLYHANELPFR